MSDEPEKEQTQTEDAPVTDDATATEEAAGYVEPEVAAGNDGALAVELESLKDQLLRVRADFDNYRKRMLRDAEQVRQTAAASLIKDLLPVVDNLERALQHTDDQQSSLAQGVQMVLRQLQDVLKGRGVEPVSGVGVPFDPNFHEALAQQPSEDIPADHVLLEYSRGYRIGEQILRPAQVVVSSGPAT